VRVLLRMQRPLDLAPPAPVPGIVVRPYEREHDHHRIPLVFGAAFDRDPWPDDWDRFPEFDPDGVFVAEAGEAGEAAGYAICFRRRDFGYISVVAVTPGRQRRGIASALVRRAAEYLRALGLGTVRIDAYGDSTPAVATYRSLEFTVYDVLLEETAAGAEPGG